MGKFVKGEIAKIQSMVVTEIPAMLTDNFDADAYDKKRAELNLHLIQACVGGELTEGKKGNGFKFNHSLPTMEEVAELTKLMSMLEEIEDQVLVDDSDDDLSIPVPGIQKMDKPRNKKLKQAILGEGCNALYKLPLKAVDVPELAAMGAEARKAHNTTVALIVAGVVVVVAIGVGVGIYCYNKKKKDDEAKELEDIQDELDAIDVDDVDVDDPEDIDIDSVEIE